MDTFINDNIIIHLQIINEKYYIRILTISKISDYFEEIKNAYDNHIDKYDSSVHLFYNCTDLNERLINDLNYKKFKEIEKIISIYPGFWQIIPKIETNIISWYNNIYINWIKAKLNMYLDDDIDSIYFDINLKSIKWNTIDFKKYIYVSYSDSTNSNYNLLNCESTKDGQFIISKIYLLAIIIKYIENNYTKILRNEKEDNEPIKSNLIITPCLSLRGITLNKTVLLNEDIEFLFKDKLINIDINLLNVITQSTNYLEIYKDLATNQYNSSETNLYKNYYSFIETDDNLKNICDSDIVFDEDEDNIITNKLFKANSILETKKNIEIMKNILYTQRPNILDTSGIFIDQTKVIENLPKITKMIFKNLLNNNLYTYDVQFNLLKEFRLISCFVYKSEFTGKLIENINKHHISIDIINELKELINILDTNTAIIDNNFIVASPISVNIKSLVSNNITNIDIIASNIISQNSSLPNTLLQKLLTYAYVELFKKDNNETLASLVIDNIYTYLLSKISVSKINKNQIGSDLVELGVKKLRKSKGFVYGIEDTYFNKNINKNIWSLPESILTKLPEDKICSGYGTY